MTTLKKKCKKCGSVINVDALFCPSCGENLQDATDELVVLEEKENKEIIAHEEVLENNSGNKYLVVLIVSLLLYSLLAYIYIISGVLATRIKYTGITVDEIKSGELRNSFFGIVQMVYCLPLVGAFIYAFWDDLKRDFIDFKKNSNKHFSSIGLGIAGCLVLTYVVSNIYFLLGIEGDSDNQSTINIVLQSKGWLPMVISVVLIAPFTEEMLFRKSIYGTCKYKFNIPDSVTIGLITFVFALVHVASLENLKYIFQYLPLAFVITYSYHHSKNIFVPMGIHFLNNLLSVIALFLSMYMEV